jgi:hypothetical protein
MIKHTSRPMLLALIYPIFILCQSRTYNRLTIDEFKLGKSRGFEVRRQMVSSALIDVFPCVAWDPPQRTNHSLLFHRRYNQYTVSNQKVLRKHPVIYRNQNTQFPCNECRRWRRWPQWWQERSVSQPYLIVIQEWFGERNKVEPVQQPLEIVGEMVSKRNFKEPVYICGNANFRVGLRRKCDQTPQLNLDLGIGVPPWTHRCRYLSLKYVSIVYL